MAVSSNRIRSLSAGALALLAKFGDAVVAQAEMAKQVSSSGAEREVLPQLGVSRSFYFKRVKGAAYRSQRSRSNRRKAKRR